MRQLVEASILEIEGILREQASTTAGSSDQDVPVVGNRYKYASCEQPAIWHLGRGIWSQVEAAQTCYGAHRFRHTDGRWYDGIVESLESGKAVMQFLRPIKAHMLVAAHVSPGLLRQHTDTSNAAGEIIAGGQAVVLPRSDPNNGMQCSARALASVLHTPALLRALVSGASTVLAKTFQGFRHPSGLYSMNNCC